jgi:hypothetical protein
MIIETSAHERFKCPREPCRFSRRQLELLRGAPEQCPHVIQFAELPDAADTDPADRAGVDRMAK